MESAAAADRPGGIGAFCGSTLVGGEWVLAKSAAAVSGEGGGGGRGGGG